MGALREMVSIYGLRILPVIEESSKMAYDTGREFGCKVEIDMKGIILTTGRMVKVVSDGQVEISTRDVTLMI